jgi:uncharacterized membrane protein
MDLFFWIVDLLIPLVIIVLGWVFLRYPPKKINGFYGYRTRRSMSSQASWDRAHRLCGKAWVRIGSLLLLLITISKLWIPAPPEALSLVHMLVTIAAIVSPIPWVERQLKDLQNS